MLRVIGRTTANALPHVGAGANVNGDGVFALLTEQHINAIVSSKDKTVWGRIHIRQLQAQNIPKHVAKFAALGKDPRAFSKFDGHDTHILPKIFSVASQTTSTPRSREQSMPIP